MTREQFAIGCVILVAVAVVSLLAGIWWGRRDGADEIAALEADLERAIARHPAGKRRRPELLNNEQCMPLPGGSAGRGQDGFRALLIGSGSTPTEALEPTSVIPPGESDTAWTRRMGLELEAWTAAKLAETDEWLREMTR